MSATGRYFEDRRVLFQDKPRRGRMDLNHFSFDAFRPDQNIKAPLTKTRSGFKCLVSNSPNSISIIRDGDRQFHEQERYSNSLWLNSSKRPNFCHFQQHEDQRKKPLPVYRHKEHPSECMGFKDLSLPVTRPHGFAERLGIAHEMVEKHGFTTLDLLDGDCVKDEGEESNYSSTYNILYRCSGKTTPLKRIGRIGSLIPTKNQRSNFFENDDDTPLQVSSIDGLSTQVSRPGLNTGPCSVEDDFIERCNGQFSLLTPSSPMYSVKTMSSTRQSNSIVNLAATPYSSIRKRIKSVSMKYLKMTPTKRNQKIYSSCIKTDSHHDMEQSRSIDSSSTQVNILQYFRKTFKIVHSAFEGALTLVSEPKLGHSAFHYPRLGNLISLFNKI